MRLVSVVVGLFCLAACAKGFNYDAPPDEGLPADVAPSAAIDAGPPPSDEPAMPDGGSPSIGSGAGDTRVPCAMGESGTCTCATGGEGDRSCVFDASSPQDGYFGECRHCAAVAAPDAGGPCSDGMKNGFETGTDCGGSECDPCAPGGGCVVDGDCAGATCEGGTCMVTMGAGGGGAGGASGAGGAGTGGTSGAGAGGSGGTTAVADCNGQPDDTPCMRDCILNLVPVCDRDDCECHLP